MPLQIKITSFKKFRNINDRNIWVSEFLNFSTSLSNYLKQNAVFFEVKYDISEERTFLENHEKPTNGI